MKYEETFNVRSYEVDLHGALKPTPLMQYLQETADHQMRDEDVDYNQLYLREHKAFVVSRMNIEVFAPVGKYADITCRTWHVTGRAANFPRGYEIDCGGQRIAQAMSNWALVDTEQGRLIRYKDYDMSGYSNDAAPEQQIPQRFRFPETLTFHLAERTRVSRSLIDINRHMNNTMYASKLYDHLPDMDEQFITSMNLRYVHEAPYESELSVYVSDPVAPGDMDPRAEKLLYFYTETEGRRNIEAAIGLRSLR